MPIGLTGKSQPCSFMLREVRLRPAARAHFAFPTRRPRSTKRTPTIRRPVHTPGSVEHVNGNGIREGCATVPPRPCLSCHRLAPSTYCDVCTRQRDAKRNARRTWYQGDWTTTSRRARAAWVAEHGWVCAGYQRDPHPSRDLTVDHVTARDDSELAVLCRSCNARKGARAADPTR